MNTFRSLFRVIRSPSAKLAVSFVSPSVSNGVSAPTSSVQYVKCRQTSPSSTTIRWLRTSNERWKSEDRRAMLASMPKKDEGVDGEKGISLDTMNRIAPALFPDEDTPNMVVDGVKFSELPICHVKVSLNNTLFCITDHKGSFLMTRSCGVEGFKHAKKGTNIAAQATAITLSTNAVAKGIKNVRIKIKGLGPGRMSSLKGLQMGGLNIVSITDCTPTPDNGPRPRKRRKL